jgi:glycosyltransferase involved in cell wall biosynthesis
MCPDWFSFNGPVFPLSRINETTFDALFTSEEAFIHELLSAPARFRIFYVISKNRVLPQLARHRNLLFFANSTTTYRRVKRKTGIEPFRAFGGINIPAYPFEHRESNSGTIVVCTYGRLTKRVKGTAFVVKACERLYKKGYPLKLLLFDTPVDADARKAIGEFRADCPFEFILNYPVEKNCDIFHKADILAIAERKGGWSNTTAEAMASGTTVVATKIGTEDFLVHKQSGMRVRRNSFSIAAALKYLIDNPDKRLEFAVEARKRIEQFDWDRCAQQIIGHLEKLSGET